jgi:site-specific DNA recombinase
MVPPKTLRCAIYTRVSDDAGLEQDFNSLDAQREASEAYIKSQAHEGWRLIPTLYADGGFSGGSMERPALKQLLADIRAGGIDIILVYKVDRLTRSLADFAKLVEIFDQHGTSFVSVTQAFNTTNSMGRLTLHVLLSFAQFEREVTAERIRDKIAASKKKGIWMGGHPPLGYRVENRKLLVETTEVEAVRMIFRRYLELGSMLPLLTELHRAGVKTRARMLSSGKPIGGIPFTKGPLAHLLKNRTYLGELNHKDKSYRGEHAAIIDRELFESVQLRLSNNLQVSRIRRRATSALLAGKIYDDRGNRMTPTYSKKKGARYHYYACRLLIEGRRSEAGSVHRVPAADVDEQVIGVLKAIGGTDLALSSAPESEVRQRYVESLVSKVSVHKHQIVVELNGAATDSFGQPEIVIPWSPRPGRPKREMLLPHIDATKDQRPIKTEVRASIVRAVALGRRWLGELILDEVRDTEALAQRENRSKRSVQMLISLAFVAPDIIEALMEGKLSRGIGITKLVDLPSNWATQREALGLA